MKPVYDQAKAKYGADVDAILADADAVRKALPGEVSAVDRRRRRRGSRTARVGARKRGMR